jgi:predicted RNA-binding protein YlxR (DUF448 family)
MVASKPGTRTGAKTNAGQEPAARQPLPQRPVPQRTCVACRATTGKRGLVRLVRTADGHVEVDPTGKKAGRGAYLCAQRACWDLALRKDRLSAALKVKLLQGDAEELRRYAAGLPPV